jgi:4-amino-4-deoxy-L-arabinose transferase-like glycosyltransferase
MKTVWHTVLLVTVAGIVLFTRLGAPRLWDRDEPRNAGCAQEMLERGDWVVPVFNAELRTHKPVLLYWLMMASYGVFGQSEFSARFPSALLGTGTVLLTYLIGRRLFGAVAGVWAGLILTTSLMFALCHRAATPDGAFVFFTTLALFIYVRGAFPAMNADGGGAPSADPIDKESPADSVFFPASWPVVALMYAAMSVATLAKGPVGMILPTAVIGMFLLIVRAAPSPAIPPEIRGVRRWVEYVRRALRPFAPMHFLRTCWSMRPLTALFVLALVAVPWYVWVGLRTDGEWLRGFLLEHNVGRVVEPMEGHAGGILYYPLAAIIGFFPWSIFLGAATVSAARWLRRREHDPARNGFLLLLCWAGVYIGIFTLASTKLPSYITPMYPALALLAGAYIDRWTQRLRLPDELRPRLTFWTLSAVGVCLAIGVSIAAHRIFGGGDAQWLAAGGVIPIVGGLVCAALAERQRRYQAAAVMLVTATLSNLMIFAIGAPVLDRYQKNHLLLQAIRDNSVSPRVASFGRLEPTWVYYLDRPIREIPKLHLDDAEQFIESHPDAFLITTTERYEALRPRLSSDVVLLASVPYFAHEGTLVVIGRRASAAGGEVHAGNLGVMVSQ